MREYKIVGVDLGFILKKFYKDEEGNYKEILYWNGKLRGRRRDNAKIYYFKDEAISGLILARKKGNEPYYYG